MRYETIHNLQIPKIGLGTWSIGGDITADPSRDPHSIAAVRSALELGYTHFDTAEAYAAGHSEDLVGRVIREMRVPRETLFITTKVSPEHLGYEDVQRACEASLRRLGMEYIDLYLIHWANLSIRLEETFRGLNQLVRTGKVRWLGVSNFNLKQLQASIALCETPLLTNQVSYSFPDRSYERNGVLAYCQQKDVLLTAYSPVKRRNVRGSRRLAAVAQARGITVQQAALAWLTTQPRVITIPRSTNPLHQADNLRAGDMLLSAEEMEQLA
jgi:diketogulonate reductase-like aldo/keto reductase